MMYGYLLYVVLAIKASYDVNMKLLRKAYVENAAYRTHTLLRYCLCVHLTLTFLVKGRQHIA